MDATTPRRRGKKTFTNVPTQETHFATQYANQNNTQYKISSFAHGMPQRTPRDVQNIEYAYNNKDYINVGDFTDGDLTYYRPPSLRELEHKKISRIYYFNYY